jgi:hypothetical protein
MADRILVLTRPMTREKLAEFLPNFEAIKTFENMQRDIADNLPNALNGVAADADTVLTLGAYSHPPPANALAITDTASQILASQIFGA